jgi:diguanylate cyclase (GGDEF)-like protein
MDTESLYILLIEDSAFFSKAVKRQLQDIPGVIIDHGRSLAEARALIQGGRRYTLALLDIILPDSSDAEVVELCREAKIPSVVFSSIVSTDFQERMMGLNVIDYIIKDTPFSLSMLTSLTNRILHNRFTKALVVDDSKTAREYICDLLRHYQFQTLAAANGAQALEVLKEHPDIRLIVTDFHMPGMSGIEMIRTIRATHARDRLAIIGISSGGGSSIAALFIKNGANDFITKPFLREEFFFRINQNMDTLDLITAMQALADRDFLTGLHNRRYLTQVGSKLYSSQKRGKLSLVAAMIDIDHFKSINDRYGHEVGDEMLATVAKCLRANTRETDILCRYGGEEFCILAVNLSPDHLSEFFERIRMALMAVAHPIGDETISLTASIGVCAMAGDSIQDMLRKADQALYRAKDNGRNRVEIAP